MFDRNYRIRILIIFSIVVILFILIILKVFYIQVIKYNDISELANNLWNRNLPILSDRGKIYDRNGKILADNITTTSLIVIPSQILDKDKVASSLSEILKVDKKELLSHLNKKTSIERIHPEGRNLSYEIADKINDLNYDGVYLVKESKRYYPHKEILSHVLGYVGIDNQGLYGIESYYNNYLTGSDGSIKYISDGKGNRLNRPSTYSSPISGMNLYLTIDLDIQKIVENELNNAVSKYNPNQAFAIVESTNTGEILAMSSRPNFDPNNYKKYDKEIINRNLPIFNTYEPGSTFKVITLSAAINENKINLFEDKFYDSGSIRVASAKIKCWKHGGHGEETFLEVVENSCNPGFVVMGQKLGKEKLMKYIKEYGFGKKTGIDVSGEENGILFNIDNMGPVETATTSFGQGVSVTAIQQVMGVSASVNGGNLYTPYLLSSIKTSETNTLVFKNKPKLKNKVITKESSKLVRFALESVVANGTGRNAYVYNYRVGGKTGTAQKVKDGVYMDNNYILSFIGFFPADNPKYTVYVAIDNPKGVTQYGGTIAAPIAKKIIEGIIDTYNIKPSKTVKEKVYEVWDTKYIKVPNLIGLTKEEARKKLGINLKLEYVGVGDKIISQTPAFNSYLKQGSKVKILLN